MCSSGARHGEFDAPVLRRWAYDLPLPTARYQPGNRAPPPPRGNVPGPSLPRSRVVGVTGKEATIELDQYRLGHVVRMCEQERHPAPIAQEIGLLAPESIVALLENDEDGVILRQCDR